jgi:hypothetical protein
MSGFESIVEMILGIDPLMAPEERKRLLEMQIAKAHNDQQAKE